MILNADSKTYSILDLEFCPSDEPIFGADESMQQIASLHHFLVALVVSLGDVKLRPNVRKVGRENDDLHPSFLSRLLYPALSGSLSVNSQCI